MQSLLYNFMTEMLFKFTTDMFCVVRAEITSFDRENFKIEVKLCVRPFTFCFQ